MRADCALLEFRDRVFAVRGFSLHHRDIVILPMHVAASMGAARLQAGTAVKDNHHVLAQVSGLFGLTLSLTLPRGHHEHNRHDAPGNSKHRQECAQLVSPQSPYDIEKQITQGHTKVWT